MEIKLKKVELFIFNNIWKEKSDLWYPELFNIWNHGIFCTNGNEVFLFAHCTVCAYLWDICSFTRFLKNFSWYKRIETS